MQHLFQALDFISVELHVRTQTWRQFLIKSTFNRSLTLLKNKQLVFFFNAQYANITASLRLLHAPRNTRALLGWQEAQGGHRRLQPGVHRAAGFCAFCRYQQDARLCLRQGSFLPGSSDAPPARCHGLSFSGWALVRLLVLRGFLTIEMKQTQKWMNSRKTKWCRKDTELCCKWPSCDTKHQPHQNHFSNPKFWLGYMGRNRQGEADAAGR